MRVKFAPLASLVGRTDTIAAPARQTNSYLPGAQPMRTSFLAPLLALSYLLPSGQLPAAEKARPKIDKQLYGKMPDGTPVEQLCWTAVRTPREDDDLRGHDHLGGNARPQRQGGEHHFAPRLAGRLPGRASVLRLHRRPLRQPHRQGQVHPRRQASTRWPPTTARTTCTAASKGFDKVVWKAEPVETPRLRRRDASPTPAPTARKAIPASSPPRSPTA